MGRSVLRPYIFVLEFYFLAGFSFFESRLEESLEDESLDEESLDEESLDEESLDEESFESLESFESFLS